MILMDKNKFIKRSIEIACENVKNNTGGPFGALIIKNNQIIAEGANLVTATNDPTAHAEIVAIRKACEKLNSFQLTDCYIFSSCEPCPMCLSAIYWARPAGVFYAAVAADASKVGFDDSFIYKELDLEKGQRSIQMQKIENIPIEEVLKPFEMWDESVNRTKY